MRLFVCAELSKAAKEAVKDTQSAFMRAGIAGNYSPEEKFHITLAFIGEYGDPDFVIDALEQVSFEPFTVCLEGTGSFDDLWYVGISPNTELEALARKVRHALADAGIPFDKKKFRPHITFLRKASLPARLTVPDAGPSEETVIDHFLLMKSSQGKNGMVYTELCSFEAE